MNTLEAPQRSEAWYNARKGIPTCSRFDMILTPAKGEPAKAQETLINELIAESLMPPEQGIIKPNFVSAEMEHGIILEAEARCCFELQYAQEPVKAVGFIIAECGLYGGSPDALVGDDSGVEIKCPNASTHIGYIRGKGLPNEYRCQVHGYMIVTGRSQWNFFSYVRNLPPFYLPILRDDFTAKLEAELIKFCKRYNEARAAFDLPPIGAK